MRQYELKGIIDSYEWLIKEDLVRLDNRIRAIYEEARKFGVSQEKADPVVVERLRDMALEVKREQEGRYGRKAAGA